jgi:hypothetical protein
MAKRPDPPADPPATDPPKPRPQPAPAPPPEERLERAVRELNAIYVVAALDAALAMADTIVALLLDGDESRAADPQREPILQRLAAHEGLRFSPHQIWTALAVHRQLSQLPDEVARELPLSHHRLLLRIPDLRAKTALARQAARDTLGKRDLEAIVTRWRATHDLPPIGRPPEPEVIRGLRRAAAALSAATRAAERGSVTREVAEEAGRWIETVERRLERLAKGLGR